MFRELIRQLKTLKNGKVNPRAEWLQNNRELLLSQIRNTVPSKAETPKMKMGNFWSTLSILFPKKFVFMVLRPVSVFLIILTVVTNGWISTVDASYEALPGDLLYPAKRAAEKTRVVVAAAMGDKKTEAKLHSEFAKRRAQETKKIINSPDPSKKEKAVQSVADLKKEIANVSNKLEEIKNDAGSQLSAEVVQQVTQNTDQIKIVLQDVKDNLITASSTLNTQLTKEVAEAKDMAKDTVVKTVEVVVSKHLEGDAAFSKEGVEQVIGNTLQAAVQDMAESKQNADGVNKVIDAMTTEVKDLVTEDNSNKQNGENTSSTVQLSDITNKIQAVATETKEAASKTAEVAAATDKTILEVKDLLSNGELTKIMDIVKEVSEASKEVEKITDNTLKNVQSVLPIVDVVKEDVVTASPSSTITVIVSTTTPVVADTLPITVIVSSTVEKKEIIKEIVP